MAKNIYNNNKPSAKVSLNGFDGGQFQVYSMKAGIASPCFFAATNPKFKCRINVQNFMMAENLRQNAFLRAKQNIDFFFIPYRQLSHLFPALYYGRNDLQTQFFDKQIDEAVPLFSMREVLYHLKVVYSMCKAHLAFMRAAYPVFVSAQLTEDNTNASISFQRFVTSVVYNAYRDMRTEFDGMCGEQQIPASKVCYYLYACQHMDSNELSDFLGNDQSITWRNFFSDLNYNVEDCLRVLDMLGYGNYFEDFEMTFYDDFFEHMEFNFDSYIQGLLNSNPTTWNDFSHIWMELMVQIGNCQWSSSFSPAVNCNAFNLLAYQKVFDNVYRNSILHDPYKYGEPLVSSFNVDAVDSRLDQYYGVDKFIALCICPYFIQHRRNITNGLWNSPAFGGNVSVPTDDMEPSFPGEHDAQTGQSISIPDLRLGFALQQFRERLLRCGTREKDLLRGLFGTKSRYISDDYVYYIGSFDGAFNVNTVQDVSGENLGRLGGNIMSSVTGHQLEFSTEEFGVIIGIHSVLPTMVYGSFGIDLINRKSEQFDFYHPDFENLGLQPVFLSQFNNIASTPDKVIGYGARFIEYKQKLDLSHGLFADTFAANGINHNDQSVIVHETKRGSDSDYVTNFDNSTIGTLSAQYVSPFCLDNIFDTATDYQIYSDHFKCWLNVQCDMLQPMSVLGLPQLS